MAKSGNPLFPICCTSCVGVRPPDWSYVPHIFSNYDKVCPLFVPFSEIKPLNYKEMSLWLPWPAAIIMLQRMNALWGTDESKWVIWAKQNNKSHTDSLWLMWLRRNSRKTALIDQGVAPLVKMGMICDFNQVKSNRTQLVWYWGEADTFRTGREVDHGILHIVLTVQRLSIFYQRRSRQV